MKTRVYHRRCPSCREYFESEKPQGRCEYCVWTARRQSRRKQYPPKDFEGVPFDGMEGEDEEVQRLEEGFHMMRHGEEREN